MRVTESDVRVVARASRALKLSIWQAWAQLLLGAVLKLVGLVASSLSVSHQLMYLGFGLALTHNLHYLGAMRDAVALAKRALDSSAEGISLQLSQPVQNNQ